MENSLMTVYYCIIKTPIWVYILLVYLLWIGYQSSKTRVISLKKLFIMPVVFAFMSIHSMLGELKGADWMVIFWFFGLSIGALGGWFLVHRLKPQIDKKHGLVRVKGTWLTLFLIVLIFVYKYYLDFTLYMNPDILSLTWFKWSSLILLGVFTGLFVGRLLYYLRCFYKLPSVDLKNK
jgi:hypothetical protein